MNVFGFKQRIIQIFFQSSYNFFNCIFYSHDAFFDFINFFWVYVQKSEIHCGVLVFESLLPVENYRPETIFK